MRQKLKVIPNPVTSQNTAAISWSLWLQMHRQWSVMVSRLHHHMEHIDPFSISHTIVPQKPFVRTITCRMVILDQL